MLYFSDDPGRAEAARALERRLGDAVLPVPVLSDPRALSDLLSFVKPRAAVAPQGLSAAGRGLLRASGVALHRAPEEVPAQAAGAGGAAALRASAALHLALGDDEGAWAPAARALELTPGELGDVELAERLARTTEESWRILEAAGKLASKPGLDAGLRARARRGLAAARARVGDAEGAREALEAALADRPGSWETRLALAAALKEDLERALPHAQAAARAAPRGRPRAEALRLLGELRDELGDAAGAAESLEAALRESPGDVETLVSLARARRGDARRAAEAASRLDAAAGRVPDWARASADRRAARLRQELGDPPAAAQAWRRVLESEPDDVEALGALRRDGAAPAPPRPRPAPGPTDGPDAGAWDEAAETSRREREAGRFAAAAAAAARFHESAAEAPAWMRADAYRVAASLWAELGLAERAERAASQAQALGGRVMATARAQVRHQVRRTKDGEPTEFDRHLALLRVDAARLHAALGDAAAARRNLDAALALVPGLESAPEGARDFVATQKRHLAALYAAARRELAQAERPAPAPAPPPAPRGPSPASVAQERAGRGRMLLDARDHAGAEAALEEAQRAAPEEPSVLALLAALRLAQERPGEARQAADRLVAATPRADRKALTAALRLRAQARRAEGDAAGESADLAAVLAAEPEDVESLARLLDAAGAEPARALALVEASEPPRRSHARATWLAARGLARSRAGDAGRAKRDFEAAAALDAEAACVSTPLRRRPERLDEAYFDACLARLPADPGLYSGRAVRRFLAGEREEAAADFRKVLELRPGDADAARSLEALKP